MDRITILQAGDDKVKTELACTAKRAAAYDYEIAHFDLTKLGPQYEGDLISKNGFIPCKFKPYVILRTLEMALDLVVYLDADVALVYPIDDLRGDYDLGVTIRSKGEIDTHTHVPDVGKVNTGVLMFYPTAIPFVTAWLETTKKTSTEQRALNEMLDLDCKIGTIKVQKNGLRVMQFDSQEYNNTSEGLIINSLNKAKLVHFKGGEYKRIHSFCVKEHCCENSDVT